MLLFFVVFGGALLLFYILNQYVDNQKNKKMLESLNQNLDKEFKTQVTSFFLDIKNIRKEYFTQSEFEKIAKHYASTYGGIITKLQNFSTPSVEKNQSLNAEALRLYGIKTHIIDFVVTYANLQALVTQWNQQYVDEQLRIHRDFFSDIDKKSLDLQQRKAVITDEDNNLVIAGAGSGKTLTIAGKVAYLVRIKGIQPERILLITFTKKAAEEMQKRIVQQLDIPVNAMTFHALGNSIIAEKNGAKPTVEDNSDKIISNYFENEVHKDQSVLSAFITFLGQYMYEPKKMEDIKTLGDFIDSHRHVELETFRSFVASQKNETFVGEKVKSAQEVQIANYLFLHGIRYEYEKEFEHETADLHHRQYRPDFYLPDYDLYIEHYGVDNNERARWLSQLDEKGYIESMRWKRELHRQYRTRCIETYSHEFSSGLIFSNLENKLAQQGIAVHPVSEEQMKECYQAIKNRHSYIEVAKLFGTFLSLFKSNGYMEDTIPAIQMVISSERNDYIKERRTVFLKVFRGLYSYYEAYLLSRRRIDFNDMINIATAFVDNNQVKHNYRYVLIDEYQDISVSRYKLINAIKKQSGAKLMAVGDDWQSIFRFAGSDISLFASFEKKFGKAEILKIEKTYRNSQQLLDIASGFIQKNPNQIPKSLKSDKHLEYPVSVRRYNTNPAAALAVTLEKFYSSNPKKSILILGRNNRDINFLEEHRDFAVEQKNDELVVIFRPHPDQQIRFLTVHRSKGLEADEVILVNCKNTLNGFPNQIADDPILRIVLGDDDQFQYGEERRLFYVALTRTRNSCVLISPPASDQSVFVQELMQTGCIVVDELEKNTDSKYKCPVCKTGTLVHRIKGEHLFYGCSNYRQCSFTIPYAPNLPVCVKCGSYMVRRKGVNGEFYGCKNYPYCRHTKNISPEESRQIREAEQLKHREIQRIRAAEEEHHRFKSAKKTK